MLKGGGRDERRWKWAATVPQNLNHVHTAHIVVLGCSLHSNEIFKKIHLKLFMQIHMHIISAEKHLPSWPVMRPSPQRPCWGEVFLPFLLFFYYFDVTALLPPPRQRFAIRSVCLSFYLSVLDYCKSNQWISLKLGVTTGPTNQKHWLTFDGDPDPDTDSISITIVENGILVDFFSISDTVTGWFLRYLVKWLMLTRYWIHN